MMSQADIAVALKAYHKALLALSLVDRDDPLARLLAEKVVRITQNGVRDPVLISAAAIKELGIR